MATSEVGRHVWGKWLPSALQQGSIKWVPKPVVYGKGLEQLQDAINRNFEGVSGEKIVVDMA